MNEMWQTALDLIDVFLGLDLGDPFVLLLIAFLVFGSTVNATKARWRRRG